MNPMCVSSSVSTNVAGIIKLYMILRLYLYLMGNISRLRLWSETKVHERDREPYSRPKLRTNTVVLTQFINLLNMNQAHNLEYFTLMNCELYLPCYFANACLKAYQMGQISGPGNTKDTIYSLTSFLNSTFSNCCWSEIRKKNRSRFERKNMNNPMWNRNLCTDWRFPRVLILDCWPSGLCYNNPYISFLFAVLSE